jgi:aryl-alcohol dehydrogenase-like predicted oxidoreductase
VLGDVVPAFERLRQQGKTRFLGLTAIGDTAALHRVIDVRVFDSAQVVYNMLNPSAAAGLAANYPAQDYGRLFDHTQAAGVGVVGIRVLAGGALSGSAERHPIASPPPEPIGTAMSYDADVVRARRLMPLVKEGFAASLTEAATRFAVLGGGT